MELRKRLGGMTSRRPRRRDGASPAVPPVPGALGLPTVPAAKPAHRRTARLALVAALVISVVYLFVGTILVPRLWIHPLGPLLKVGPIMVLNLVALAILDDR